MLIDELNDSELDYYMMILHNLNSPHALAALKELASEEGVNFEKLLAPARQSNQVLGSSGFGKSGAKSRPSSTCPLGAAAPAARRQVG